MPQPTQDPQWNTNGTNRVEPPSGQKASGWTIGQAPPSSYFNWWMNLVYQWCLYLKNLTSEALTWLGFQTFNNGIRSYGNNLRPGVRADTTGFGFAAIEAQSAYAAEEAIRATNTNLSGTAIKATANGSNAIGVRADSTSGSAVYATTSSGYAIRAFATGSGKAAQFNASSGSANTAVEIFGSKIGLNVQTQSGSGGENIPTIQAVGGPAYGFQGRPALLAIGGGNDDPANDQQHNSGAAIVAKGGLAYGSDQMIPAIPNVNAGPGIIARGGDVLGEYNDGLPGEGLIAYGGNQVDSLVNDTVGGTAIKAVAGTGDGGKGLAIDADGAIKCNDALKLVGGNLAANAGQNNQLTPGLIVKAWARVRISAGTYQLLAGQNVSSLVAGTSPTAGQFKINLASPVPRASRVVIAHSDIPTHAAHPYDYAGSAGATDSVLSFEVVDRLTSATINLNTQTVIFHVIVMGLQ
jgi:hypothetical protein